MSEVHCLVITYCTNIHSGESWEAIWLNLQTHIPAVKEAISPAEPFPIGLRLSNRAARELNETSAREFSEWCRRQGCFVPTINGFPYGSFHFTAIKEKAYLPDWRSRDRSDYTNRLADLLDQWLPDGVAGSISSVPIGFKRHVGKDDYPLVMKHLLGVLEHLDALKQKSGKEIILALEPEPGCVLETTAEAVTFFERTGFPEELQKCLGICLDCCHQAVEFEEPAEAVKSLREAGIRIAKVQLSSALRMQPFDRGILEQLSEPTYLHQTVVRGQNGSLVRYDDLPEALRLHRVGNNEEWRIHFHVPIFLESIGKQGTTRFFIQEMLPLLEADTLLEVETYTWEILPPELKGETVAESIIREIEWVKALRK
jgi:hypothetical protein